MRTLLPDRARAFVHSVASVDIVSVVALRIRTIPAESRAKAFHASTSGAEAFLRHRPTGAPPTLLKREIKPGRISRAKKTWATFPCFRPWSRSCRTPNPHLAPSLSSQKINGALTLLWAMH
jgi:hypothetical protein